MNITKSSFVLMGFKIQKANALFSYDASLSNLSEIGGTFILNPQGNTSIIYAYFSIILIEQCFASIELQLISKFKFIKTTSRQASMVCFECLITPIPP
jgi:hypothetical protein